VGPGVLGGFIDCVNNCVNEKYDQSFVEFSSTSWACRTHRSLFADMVIAQSERDLGHAGNTGNNG
jgi:hypothetical protein